MQGIVGAEADTIEVHDVPPPLSIAGEILFSSLYQREKVKTPTWESVRKFNDTESYAIRNRYRYFYHCWKSVVSISHFWDLADKGEPRMVWLRFRQNFTALEYSQK